MKEIHVKEDEMIEIVNDQEIEIRDLAGGAEALSGTGPAGDCPRGQIQRGQVVAD